MATRRLHRLSNWAEKVQWIFDVRLGTAKRPPAVITGRRASTKK